MKWSISVFIIINKVMRQTAGAVQCDALHVITNTENHNWYWHHIHRTTDRVSISSQQQQMKTIIDSYTNFKLHKG